VQLGEEKFLEDLVQVEVDALLRDSLHQVGGKAFIKAVHSLLPQGGACQIGDSLVLLGASATHELALLNPGPEGGDGVGEQSRKHLAQTAADEVLFGDGRLGDLQILVEKLGPLVDVHLDYSGEGKNETQFEPSQKALGTALSVNLLDLFFDVFKLADIFVHIEEHSGFEYPNRLSNKGG
jgi:hypothetical protein